MSPHSLLVWVQKSGLRSAKLTHSQPSTCTRTTIPHGHALSCKQLLHVQLVGRLPQQLHALYLAALDRVHRHAVRGRTAGQASYAFAVHHRVAAREAPDELAVHGRLEALGVPRPQLGG